MATAAHRQEESELTRFFALFPSPGLARDIFTIVEGHRVDALLRAAYPGIRRDMALVLQATVDRRPDPATLGDAQGVVEVLLQHAMGVDADTSRMAPATRAVAGQAVAAMDAVLAEGARVADAADITARIYELIDDGLNDARRRAMQTPDQGTPPPPQEGGDATPQQEEAGETAPQGIGGAQDYQSIELPPFMTPVMEELVRPRPDPRDAREQKGEAGDGADQQLPDDVKTMQTSQVEQGAGQQDEVAKSGSSQAEDVPTSPGSAPDARTDDAEGGGSDMLPSGDLAQVPLVQGDKDEEPDLGEQAFPYDEWDHKIEDYRPAWCTLRESRATRQQEGFVAATFHEFGGIVSQIRRNFQLMRPERLRKMRYQTEGDDLDTDGLVEYVVDRRARIAPSGRVYIKRDKKDRDVTTAFLVDMSSSTDRKIDGRKRIIDIEKEALLLMCEALEAIRDEYAIYGFSGSGRDDCQFYVVKEIGERYDDRVKARIGGIYGRQKTRMGPAIRHATKRLMGVDSNVKLMILLTDGKPYDSDTYQDNTYAQEDTKMALREARREKIHLFCVTVDREGADYLPHMYSDANFVIIDDVRTLPQRLPQLYRRLTT
ncbi:MAG: VWA domain-containing protein [Actinomycetota bacterium]